LFITNNVIKDKFNYERGEFHLLLSLQITENGNIVELENLARNIIDSSTFKVFKGKKSNTPLKITINKKVRFIRIQLQAITSLNLEKIVLIENSKPILPEFNVLASSVYDSRFNPCNVIGEESDGNVTFHSKNEKDPWLLIYFPQQLKIDSIEIYNRDDDYYWRALSIKLEVSNNLKLWENVYDNLDYKNDNKYNSLTNIQKAIVDCYAMQIDPIIELLDKISHSDSEQANAIHSQANNLLNIRGRSLGPHGITKTFKDKSNDEINLAYKELSSLLNILNNEYKLSTFISSGTLLGIVRDNGFIGHDDDIDLCYISNFSNQFEILNERKTLCSFLQQKGYSILKSKDIAHIWIKSSEGISFDLFTGWKENSNCIMNPLDIEGVSVNVIFPLKIWGDKNLTIYMPNNAEDLLKLNYGDNWRTPDPFWKFDWSKAARDYSFLYGELK